MQFINKTIKLMEGCPKQLLSRMALIPADASRCRYFLLFGKLSKDQGNT